MRIDSNPPHEASRELDAREAALMTYSDPGRGIYVSLSGYARLVYDPDRIFALWDERVEAWFAQGPLDPRLALLRVDVDHAEYWDDHARGMIRLLALAHAALGREPPAAAGEHGRLQMRIGGRRETRRA